MKKYAFNQDWSKLQFVAALLALGEDDEIELFGEPFDKTVVRESDYRAMDLEVLSVGTWPGRA